MLGTFHLTRPRGRPRVSLSADILATRTANLVSYWMLDEPSGTTAADASGNSRTGTHTSVTVAQPGIGDGRTSTVYNGTTGRTSIDTAAMRTGFNGDEGSVLMWLKASSEAIWSDGITRRAFWIRSDGSNTFSIGRTATNNVLVCSRTAAGVAKTRTLNPPATAGWFSVIFTWSTTLDRADAYLNGIIGGGGPATALSPWVNTYTSSPALFLGAQTTTTNFWSGSIAHVAVWSVALTPYEAQWVGRR